MKFYFVVAFSLVLSLKSEFFEGIDNEKVNEVFSGNKKTLDYNVKICLNTNLLHEGLLNKVEKNMKELHVNDNKISRLILKKTVKLEVENKALQENNKEITKYLEIMKKSLTQAQNELECLKKTHKKLEFENNNLLAKLETSKKRLSRKRKLDDNIQDVQSTNCNSVKSKLIKLFLLLFFFNIFTL